MLGGESAKRVFRRIARWGDGWLPVVQDGSQLVDGRNQIQAACKEEGRDPDVIQIIVLGAPGQYCTRAEQKALAAAGFDHVVLWLQGEDVDAIDKEMTALAEELF